MDLEPHLIKKESSEFDSPRLNKESDQLLSDDEDPYSFNGTSNSLLGLGIACVMIGIPLLAVFTERPSARKSLIPTSIDQYGSKSSTTFAISGFSKLSS